MMMKYVWLRRTESEENVSEEETYLRENLSERNTSAENVSEEILSEEVLSEEEEEENMKGARPTTSASPFLAGSIESLGIPEEATMGTQGLIKGKNVVLEPETEDEKEDDVSSNSSTRSSSSTGRSLPRSRVASVSGSSFEFEEKDHSVINADITGQVVRSVETFPVQKDLTNVVSKIA
ncbi:hypothetical protein BC829DRAFT_77128 [Chytridium lagenaria]|nr:hypothetical protein BC829DRAFT_77128 [Chytridium lagenaria]